MSKSSRTIHLAVCNITTHPHSPADYKKLIFKAVSLKQPVKVWGDTHAFLATAYKTGEADHAPLVGEIFTFLELSRDLGWFDLLRGEEATEEQTGEVAIPPNLRPHLKRHRFAFFPEEHAFVFVSRDSRNGSISPNKITDFLSDLLNDPRILLESDFPQVAVTLYQDRSQIEEIFRTLQVHQLRIMIKRPNGDTPDDAGPSIEEEFEDQNIAEYFIQQKAVKGKRLDPDRRTVRYMEEAVTNGFVEATGSDAQEITRTVNTKSKPLIEPVRFDGELPYSDFILREAEKLLRGIK